MVENLSKNSIHAKYQPNAIKNKFKNQFSMDDFVEVDLRETIDQNVVNTNGNNDRKNADPTSSSYKELAKSDNTNFNIADKLTIHKLNGKPINHHRRIRSEIDISTLSLYNYRFINDGSTTIENSNKKQSNINKFESMDGNTRSISVDMKALNIKNCLPLSGKSLNKRTKLEAEVKANLISKVGAIGLPMNDRPAGLPPKSRDELEMQQKIHHSIVKRSMNKLEKETKYITDKLIETNTKEQKLSHDFTFWTNLVDNWDNNNVLNRKKVHKKISEGIPSYTRGKIWKLLSSNKISVDNQVFDSMFNDPYTFSICNPSTKLFDNEIYCSIEIDVGRTFPHLKLFQKNNPMHEDLCKLLYVFQMYNYNIGYSQGMPYPMAIFLLNLDLYDCFLCFNNFVSSPLFTALYTCDSNKMDEIYIWFETVISVENPKLISHIHHINLSPSMYILDWLMSGFCKIFTLEVVSRIFDNYFLEGTSFFLKCAMMILNYHANEVLATYDPVYCAQLLTRPLIHLDEHQIFKHINNLSDYKNLYSQLELSIKF